MVKSLAGPARLWPWLCGKPRDGLAIRSGDTINRCDAHLTSAMGHSHARAVEAVHPCTSAARRGLQDFCELAGQLRRARLPTRVGCDGFVRLCAEAAARLFRQRRSFVGHQRREPRRTAPRLGHRTPRERHEHVSLAHKIAAGVDDKRLRREQRLDFL
jgi:hypothetical protein